MEGSYTTLSITEQTKRLLANNSKGKETYEQLLKRLLREYEGWSALVESEHLGKLKMLNKIKKLDTLEQVKSYVNGILNKLKKDEFKDILIEI